MKSEQSSTRIVSLPAADRFLAAVMDSSDDAVITKDLQGIITSWNRSAEKLFGYTAEEAIGKPVAMLIPKGRKVEEPNMLARLRKGERIEHYETVRQRKDGTLLDISITVSPVNDDQGQLIGASKVARDITFRKKTEQTLQFMAAIVDSSDDAIITKDLEGIITTWNRSAEKLFGYTAQEAIGKPVTILIPPDRANEEPEILGRIRKGEKIDHYETVRQRKDGTRFPISLTVSPVKDKQGKVIGASKVARDITSQKEFQAASKFMNAVVESSDDAIITKNLEGIITSWNKTAEKLFGYTSEEAVGQPMTMLMPPDRVNEEPQILARLRKGERIDHYETVRQRKDGTLLDISITVSPVKDEKGKVIGASKIARDITERKRTEAELRRAKEELVAANAELEKRVKERTASLEKAITQMEEFSYSVSHDLRSPIRAMKGYAEAVLADYGPKLEERVQNLLERIVTSGIRMERLINDVLTYSRLVRAESALKAVEIDKLVPEIIQQYDSMQPPNAEIIIRQPLHPVMAHEPSLMQAISNLLANGIKFVAKGTRPRIVVWSEANNGHVKLWVQDNGIGIKPEYQNRLFGMFERVHQSKDYEGTGIGLAIVRKAVEKMGGNVGVKSDGVRGSNFWIELPAAKDRE